MLLILTRGISKFTSFQSLVAIYVQATNVCLLFCFRQGDHGRFRAPLHSTMCIQPLCANTRMPLHNTPHTAGQGLVPRSPRPPGPPGPPDPGPAGPGVSRWGGVGGRERGPEARPPPGRVTQGGGPCRTGSSSVPSQCNKGDRITTCW